MSGGTTTPIVDAASMLRCAGEYTMSGAVDGLMLLSALSQPAVKTEAGDPAQ